MTAPAGDMPSVPGDVAPVGAETARLLEAIDLPPENIYGHVRRISWITERVPVGSIIIEFGCGTGYMLSYPLLQLGYHMIGVDVDQASVARGREFLRSRGLPAEALRTIDIGDLHLQAEAIVASEVFEHIATREYDALFAALRSRLKPGGLLFVTVPNGYGWFELESFLWFKLRLGRVVELLRVPSVVRRVKRILNMEPRREALPATVAESPHVQRFTLRRIRRLLEEQGFEVLEVRGSVLCAGPFSHLFFTGIRPVMKLNEALGRRFTSFASGFYLVARRRE